MFICKLINILGYEFNVKNVNLICHPDNPIRTLTVDWKPAEIQHTDNNKVDYEILLFEKGSSKTVDNFTTKSFSYVINDRKSDTKFFCVIKLKDFSSKDGSYSGYATTHKGN